MSFNDFWINNNGKKEQLNNAKHGVRKEQMDKKFYNLFDAYDANGDGTLETEELEGLFTGLTKFSGGDKTLDMTENKQVASLFANKVGIKDADFMGFVKSVSDASEEIVSSTTSKGVDGGNVITTTYKNGLVETIYYYPDGEFKLKTQKQDSVTESTTYIYTNDGKNYKQCSQAELDKMVKDGYKKQRAAEQRSDSTRITFEDGYRINFMKSHNVMPQTNKHEIHIDNTDMSDRAKAEVEIRDFVISHYVQTHKDAKEALKTMGILDDIGAAINAGAGELWNSIKNVWNGTDEEYQNFYELVKNFEPNYNKALVSESSLEEMRIHPVGYFTGETANINTEKGLQFQQTTEQYQNATILKSRIDILKDAMREISMYESEQNALTYVPAQSEGMNPASHILKANNLLLQYFDGDKEAVNMLLNGTIGNAQSTINAIKGSVGDTQKMFDSVTNGKSFDEIKNDYQTQYKEIYRTDFVPDELTEKVMDAKATGGMVKLAAITAISILITKSPVMAEISAAAGGAEVTGAAANMIRTLASRYGASAVQQGIKFAMSSGTLATDVGLALLNQVTSERGVDGKELWESAKGSAKYIYFGAYIGAPLAQAVSKQLGKIGATARLFEGGVKSANGAIQTTSITGEKLVQNLMKGGNKVLTTGGAFLTDVAAFSALEVATEGMDPVTAGKEQTEMLGKLKIMNHFIEYMLGGKVLAGMAKTQMDAAIERSGVKNWNIKEIKTPNKTVYEVEVGEGLPKVRFEDANTLTTAMLEKVTAIYETQNARGASTNEFINFDQVKEKAPAQIMKPTEATTFDKSEGITFKPNVNPNDAPSNAYKIEWGKTVEETIKLNQKNGVPLELIKDETTGEYFLGIKHSWDDQYYRVDRNSIIVKYCEGDFAPVAEDNGAHIFTQTYLDAKTGKPIDVSKMKPSEPVQIVKNPNSTVGAVAFEKPTTVNSLEGKMQDVEMTRTDVDGHPYGTYEQLAKDIRKGKLVANKADPNSARFIELVKAGKDKEAMALLKQVSLKPSVSDNSPATINPHNITQIATPEEVGARASEALAGSKHRIATAGYSAPPEGYEVSTREFLKALDKQLGSKQTSFVTSPTADKGSIDAITTEVAGFDKGRLFYTTAQDYVDYINPENFPATIDKTSYSTVPKFVLPDAASYSAATAQASNAFIATGGRNATVSDYVNAIKNGNKAVILDNTSLDVPTWGEAKNRVENASKYLSEQIKAVREGRELPYPEIGEFTRQFIEENITKIEALTRTYQIDGTPESIKIAAKKSAAFIESKFLADAPLSAKSPLIQNSKVSMISKPNDVEGIVPDLTAGDKVLSDYGLVKDGDKWYAPNREWFPRAITEDDIIIVYGRDANGKPSNIGFCSKSEFSSLYTDRAKYKNGSIEFINAENLPKGQVVEATKCASGEVCILPVGTKLETNEGIVEVKPGEIVIINEAKNSVYATNITEILKRYKNDPLNPASKELFNLLNEFAAKESTLSETEKLNYHQKIADSFGRLNRGQKLCELEPNAVENPPQTLRQEYDLAAKIATDFETKFLSRIDVSNFDTALTQARDILTEIYQNTSLTPLQKQATITSVMVKLLPKTNAHQHTKGSLPKETAMQLAQKKGYTQEQIAELEAAYSAGEAGFATLTDFNNAYGTIGRLVNTPSDYKIAIDGIIRKAVSEGQLTTEIRCACDSLRDENGRYLSPEEGTKVILDAIEETKAQLRAEGKEVPATGYVFLTYRGKDWDASLSAATVQAKQAVKTAMEHPDMKFGFDIAGPEDSGWGPKAFEESLGIIREYNERVVKGEVQGQKIGITMHAGETPTFDGGRPGYESVREAIEMGADRIGHGVQAVLDDTTMQMMKDADVTVEICGVCNIQSIPINTEGLAIHPIQQFIDRGIKVSLCTDNDAICGSNITKEYNQFLLTGHSNFMNWNNVKQSARDGIEAAFIPESAKVEARNMLEDRINQIQNMLNEVAGQYDGITSIETKMADGRAVRVGVLDVFGEKHRGIAINGVEKDFAHGDLVAGALESYVKDQNVDIVKFPVKVSNPKKYDGDGKLISPNTKSNLRLDTRSLLKELKKLNSLPEEQKLDYLNLSNSISLEYKVNGREISPADLANPEIRAEIRASLPEAVEHILQELETLVNNGTEVYISAGNRRNTFSAFSLVEGIHTIGGKNLATGEPLSYLTNHALIEEHVGLPLYMTGAKGGQKVLEDPNIKGVRMAGIIDQQSPLAKMSKWQLSKKVATNADYAELKKYADEIIAAGKKKIDINFFQYSFAFTLPEKFRYKIYDTQRFIAMFEGHLDPEVLEYIKPMGTHCDIQYRQFFDMKAKEGHHVMPMSKTTAVRNTVSGTSFGPAQVIARKIKEEQEK